jgi:hypothetical protein
MKKPLLFDVGPKSAVTIFEMLLRTFAFVFMCSLATGCFGGAQPEPPNVSENGPDSDVRGDAGASSADAGVSSAADDGGVFDADAAVGCPEDGGSHDTRGDSGTAEACDPDGGHAH